MKTLSFLSVVIVVVSIPSLSDAAESWASAAHLPTYLSLALQTHQPTKSGNVPHLNPEEQTSSSPQPTAKLDPEQLQREARELLELSQSLQADVASIARGLRPKDATEKLKRIQKLAKHLRGEIGS
jgi:hypothetical protein